MTIKQLTKDSFEFFTIKTNPHKNFVSSSVDGITGNVHIFQRRSHSEKELFDSPHFTETPHKDSSIQTTLSDISRFVHDNPASSIEKKMSTYLDNVNEKTTSAKSNKSINVYRFNPSTTFDKNTVRKSIVKNTLNPYYRATSQTMQWACSNYYSLNFFTASCVPTSSVLIYPMNTSTTNYVDTQRYIDGNYVLPQAWSFEFFINPRYANDVNAAYNAGTILHMSGCYAISLVSGSSKDADGYVDGYRLQLQLSRSADIAPSVAQQGSAPNDFIFLTSDNVLKRNSWHHVAIRWGTNAANNGTGSFVIDGVEDTAFAIDESSVSHLYGTITNPYALFVGNFYEGSNTSNSSIARFFADDAATREGLTILDYSPGVDEPDQFTFRHQLNAELHDICIRNYYMTDSEIAARKQTLSSAELSSGVLFYLPPFFRKDSPQRYVVGDDGGVMQTPFQSADGYTDDPFNVALSFGSAGHLMNLENFVYDFAAKTNPRQYCLTASTITSTTTALTANDHLYQQKSTRARNLLILPCDDGNFKPKYEILVDNSTTTTGYIDDLGNVDLSLVSLSNLVGDSFLKNPNVTSDPGVNNLSLSVATLSEPGLSETSQYYTVISRTRDTSSNQVTFFDVSNMYYGNNIKHKSIILSDTSMTGSDSKVSITLRDDGSGNLYRADSNTPHAKWATVGNAYYNEGILCIKDPSLYFIGKDKFDLKFDGDQNIHVLKMNVVAGANELITSNNPNYVKMPPSNYANEQNSEFVYITGLNFHDRSLNVVMKSQLAQPIIKRKNDRFLFRIRYDF